MIFAITEGTTTLSFWVCILTCYKSGNEAQVGTAANQTKNDMLDEFLFSGE